MRMRAIAIGTLLVAGAASAREPESRQAREFVQAAGHADSFEIMAATTALAQSQDPQVRAFARQMIRDHGRMSLALRQATAGAGLEPPPMAVGSEQAPMLAALQSLRGRAFDQAYVKQQALAHRSALVVEEQYAATGDAPAVRQAATEAVPLIRSHLAMAERISAQIGDR